MLTITAGNITIQLPEAWVEDRYNAQARTERTISGKVVVFLPSHYKITIFINACTQEQAYLLSQMAKTGQRITVSYDGATYAGVISKIDIRHIAKGMPEHVMRSRVDLYVGTLEVEVEP